MTTPQTARELALGGSNKLKLGVFSANVSRGGTMTAVPEALALDWQQNLSIQRTADDLGFEILIPVGRWRSFGGPSDFNADSFEAYPWAAGVGYAAHRLCRDFACHDRASVVGREAGHHDRSHHGRAQRA